MITNALKITSNKHGIMHKLNPISEAFIEFGKSCKNPVLDVGCAYGVATLPALANGTKVIACDISKEHLNTVVKESNNNPNLTTIHAAFPAFDLPPNSIDAVLLSNLLPFLSGAEIEIGLSKLQNWLTPNGKIFILSYTIYNRLMAPYIPAYEARKSQGDKWPGELTDASLYWDKANPLSQILPHKLNHFEPSTLKSPLERHNFIIEQLEFLNIQNDIPEEVKLAGKETMSVIAHKF